MRPPRRRGSPSPLPVRPAVPAAESPPLSPDQRRRAVAEWRAYLAAPPITGFLGDRTDELTPGDTYVAQQADRDRRRDELIDAELGPLTADFLAGRSDLAAFKSAVDGANKRRNLLGFSGMKGQMFFNMLYNAADRSAKTATVAEVTAETRQRPAAPGRRRRGGGESRPVPDVHGAAGGRPRRGRELPPIQAEGLQRRVLPHLVLADRRPRTLAGLLHQQRAAAGRPEPVGNRPATCRPISSRSPAGTTNWPACSPRRAAGPCRCGTWSTCSR